MAHETERVASPQTLVCTRDHRRCQRRCDEHRKQLASLDSLTDLAGKADVPSGDARKERKLKGSVMDLAAAMGIEVLTEAQYFELQTQGEFDTKRSSWLKTPSEIRRPGGAIFGDRRFGRVFIYHNGAESYYSARAFRGSLRV
jgi:hypothetical protein